MSKQYFPGNQDLEAKIDTENTIRDAIDMCNLALLKLLKPKLKRKPLRGVRSRK